MLPINTNLIGCHILRFRPKAPPECLLLHRSQECSYYPGIWQMLTGKIEEGETVVQAVLREIEEETKLQTATIFSLNYVSRFFEKQDESIYLVPLFLAVVPHSARVILNPPEHDKYRWCNFQEALRYLTWNQHRKALLHVRREFLEREPNQHLKLYDANAEKQETLDIP